MGLNIGKLKTNKAKEKNGVWIEQPEGHAWLVARFNNQAYQEYLASLLKPHRSQIRLDTFSMKIRNELVLKAFAKTVLLGWRNVQNEDGSELVYSPEKAEEILTLSSDLYELIGELAMDANNFKDVEPNKEAALGN